MQEFQDQCPLRDEDGTWACQLYMGHIGPHRFFEPVLPLPCRPKRKWSIWRRIGLLLNRFGIGAVVLAILVSGASAQNQRYLLKPWTWMKSNATEVEYQTLERRHDSMLRSGKFWAGVGVIALSMALDAHSTAKNVGRGGYEGNPLLGHYPSNRRIATWASVGTGVGFGLHAAAWKLSHNDPSRAWREFGAWGVPAAAVGVNGTAAYRNYRWRGTLKQE